MITDAGAGGKAAPTAGGLLPAACGASHCTDDLAWSARLAVAMACSKCLTHTDPFRTAGPSGSPSGLERSGYQLGGAVQPPGLSGHGAQPACWSYQKP